MDSILKFAYGMIMLSIILGIIITAYAVINIYYILPLAANKANEYCKSIGFDQYKSYDRIGILSDNPVAIKCEYAEKYTDLGVRSNG